MNNNNDTYEIGDIVRWTMYPQHFGVVLFIEPADQGPWPAMVYSVRWVTRPWPERAQSNYHYLIDEMKHLFYKVN